MADRAVLWLVFFCYGSDDVIAAIRKLKVLGSGFTLIPIGSRYLVQSVPGELTMDHASVLQQAEVWYKCDIVNIMTTMTTTVTVRCLQFWMLCSSWSICIGFYGIKPCTLRPTLCNSSREILAWCFSRFSIRIYLCCMLANILTLFRILWHISSIFYFYLPFFCSTLSLQLLQRMYLVSRALLCWVHVQHCTLTVRLSVLCLHCTRNYQTVENSNLVETWPCTRVTGEQIWGRKVNSQGHWEQKNVKIGVLHISSASWKVGQFTSNQDQNDPPSAHSTIIGYITSTETCKFCSICLSGTS